MKLILYKDKGHHKNFNAIQRMCSALNIEFEFTESLDRLKNDDYDILYSFCSYVDPDILPTKVKIIFGPHAFVFPSNDSLFVGPIDERFNTRAIYNCLSPWVHDLFFEHVHSFKMPVVPMPFSVDTTRFNTHNLEKDIDCLLYIKHRSEYDVSNVINTIKSSNLRYEVLTYGSYNEDQYINLLRRSKFMIVLDAHESQGFALQEAMSCNVPLLVIDATSMYDEYSYGRQIYSNYKPMALKATSVSYWSDECGIKTTITDLAEKIELMKEEWQTFRPRNFIVRELSEVPCMKKILDYFKLSI
jgi:glycosyltransferase involved in cell wall biosynthesis